jgi:uncharacterized delta-60 repeat protein
MSARPAARLVLALFGALLMVPTAAHAVEPLAIDTSFSGDGWFAYQQGGAEGALDASFASDGSVAMVGQNDLLRATIVQITEGGSPDGGFGGGDGIVTFDGTETSAFVSVALDSAGRLVAVGYDGSRCLIARYLPAGDLDATFGEGDGVVTTSGFAATAVAITSSGKIVVAGSFGSPQRAAVLRLRSDGSFDTSFGGGDGRVGASFGSPAPGFLAIALDGANRVVAVGGASGAQHPAVAARFRRDGTLDPTFSGDGRFTFDRPDRSEAARSVAIQPDRKIVMAGSMTDVADTDPLLVRLSLKGALDPTFDADGWRRLNLTSNSEWFNDVVVEPDGDLSMTGTAVTDQLVATSSPNGRRIWYRIKDFLGGPDQGAAVLLRNDGKLWVAGTISDFPSSPGAPPRRFGLARYFPA